MASFVTKAFDTFKNFIANVNTNRDKQSGGDYYFTPLPDNVLSTIYRCSWMGRKVVDIPANDATREWREWQAEASEIEAIEKLETSLKVKQKVQLGLKQARLLGGAALYFSIKGDDPATPLDLNSVGKDSLEFVVVLPRTILSPGEINMDPLLPGFGKPAWYELSSQSGGVQRIDTSRLVIFIGNEILNPEEVAGAAQGWGDSVLQSAYEAVRNADSTAANIASLVYEAKVDVLKIPDLAEIMANDRSRSALSDRVLLAGQLKGNNGMLVIDGDEDYQQKTFNFSGLPDINHQSLQAVSGAADIPITRFLGQSPAGLSSTGESDLRNYYDAVAGSQRLVMTPALYNLDEALIRSAVGSRPDDVFYTWSSLWQMTNEQKSKISKETADTIAVLAGTRLFADDVLAKAAANMLVEHSIMPALEYEEELDTEEDPDESGVSVGDATTPRSLYISRLVLNSGEIMAWARSQGIKRMLPPEALHVTIAFSREKLDWTEVGRDWNEDSDGRVRIPPGGPRVIELFGDSANVLAFHDSNLGWRHRSIIEKGASWDYDDYTPHITLTYEGLPPDIQPYEGPIVLGPERFREIPDEGFQREEEIAL